MEVKQIGKKIHHLHYKKQRNLTSTFLRFQEYYESPKFEGKIFTLDEYKEWYIKQKGKFTYYTDWKGFNIPGRILKPFRKGKFNPLTEKEKGILKLFKGKKRKFYIIGTYGNKKGSIKHETAHALFYLYPMYRVKVLFELGKHNLEATKKKLKKTSGYADDKLEDELRAYLIEDNKIVKSKHKKLKEKLNVLFETYSKKL